ncbi:carbohydrate esterase family 1 protein [Piromyces sp. E2]|nr:carbohydrate esterase family 1 protein [Piromyces sp. E2]|eukprot:OUM64637.1 carbohydrate esterase family 1 protein [Piromyces sp. E2]
MKFIIALTTIAAITAKVSAKCDFENIGYKCCENTATAVVSEDENGTWGIENNEWCGITRKNLRKRQWPWNSWGQNNNNNMPNFAANPWEQNNNNNNNQWNPWGQNNNQGNPWEQNNNNNQWNPWGQNNNQGNPWEQNNNNNNNNNQWNQWGQNNNQGNPWEQNNNNNQNQNQGNPWEQNNNNQNQGNSWEQNNNNQTPPQVDNQQPTQQPTENTPTGNQGGAGGASSGGSCSGKTLKSNTTLNINGRKVIVKFPSGYTGDKNVPLLINFHPIGGSATQWEGGSQTARAALNDGAIVAFMDGAQGPMGQAWNVGPCCTDADDVQYTRSFIKEITSQACIDTNRIYAAGFSMGGGMSNYSGCMLADVIAAAAPSAFDLSKEIVDSGKCKPSRPFPILNFRGTQDNVVMYDGGLSQVVPGKPITFLGAKNNLKEWAKMNGCTGEPKMNTPGNNCEMYENCSGGVKVGLCTINGGGHSEGDGKMGWDFLKQFTLQ